MRDHAIRVRLVGTARSGREFRPAAGVLSRECRNGLGAVDAAMQREAHDEENGLRVGHRGCGRRLASLRAGKFPEGLRRRKSIDAIPFETRTISDDAFRAGDKSAGVSTEIAGVLRLPIGKGPFPAVVLIEGSGGIGSDNEYSESSVPTARHSDVHDRRLHRPRHCQLGRRSIEARSDEYDRRPLSRPRRSREGPEDRSGPDRGDGLLARRAHHALFRDEALPDRLERKRRDARGLHSAHPVCNFQFLEDTEVAGGPIRIFHGAADDYVPIGPCQDYFQRLRQAGKDVEITALPGAYHAYE